MTDQEFVTAFESATLPADGFHHHDHVRLGWIYLQQGPPENAIARFINDLRRFVKKKGAESKYHETITWAYLLLINERLGNRNQECDQERHQEDSWQEFQARNPDLFTWRPSILESYYRPETLASETARRVFVLPDRAV